MNEVLIRATTPTDASSLRAALDSVARERRFLAMLEAPSVERVATFGSLSNVTQIVAVEGDVIVGWADVQRLLDVGFSHRGVMGMGVIASHRRRGIGTRLLTAVVERARSLGVSRLELEVFRSNFAAVKLYERNGFCLEGEQLRARILDGKVDDMLLMSQWIGAPE